MGGGYYSPAADSRRKWRATSVQTGNFRANRWNESGRSRRAEGVQRRLGKSLFVDGLSDQTTYQQVKNAFSNYGRISGSLFKTLGGGNDGANLASSDSVITQMQKKL